MTSKCLPIIDIKVLNNINYCSSDKKNEKTQREQFWQSWKKFSTNINGYSKGSPKI